MYQTNNNPLNKRGHIFSLVLNDSGADLFKSSGHILSKLLFTGNDVIFCACILHTLDYDEENNKYKTPHYHLVIHFRNNYRVGSVINMLCDIFHCNDNQISCEKCTNVVSQVRYLVHQDEYDKFHYSMDLIETTDKEFVKSCFDKICINSIEDCIKVCEHYNYNLQKIMINVRNYDEYRRDILDLIRYQFIR